MRSIRIRNLRSIKDSKEIDLKPITLVVGSNSSGKSTFLRLFPLLRQSSDTRTTSPILWNGDYVDFGSFEESVRRDADNQSISFTFSFDKQTSGTPFGSYLAKRHLGLPSEYDLKVKARIKEEEKALSPTVQNFAISVCGQKIAVDLDSNNKVGRVKVNNRIIDHDDTYVHERADEFLPRVINKGREKNPRKQYYSPSEIEKLVDIASEHLHSNASEKTIEGIIDKFIIGSDTRMISHMKNIKTDLSSWEPFVDMMDKERDIFDRVRDLYISSRLPPLVQLSNLMIGDFSKGVNYVTPVRSRTERYYRKQNLAFDELDPEGDNLAIFLRNLTKAEEDDFDTWTEDILGVRVKARSSGGHLYLTIDESTQTKIYTEYNLVDAGFGFTQVLPIITQLWSVTRERRGRHRGRRVSPKLCAIEQPELHLHPKLQARISDALVRTVDETRDRRGGAVPLIVETHSKSIVNRIGYLIEEGALDSSEVQVLLFERENPSLSSIRYASFNESGYLEDWPVGFFSSETKSI